MVRDANENGRLMIVTQNGEAKAVVMGVEQYDEWKRTLALLKLIAQGEAEVAASRLIGQDVAFGRAKAGMQKAAAGE